MLADESGRPERLAGTELHPVQCDTTLSPLSLPSLMCRWFTVKGGEGSHSPLHGKSYTAASQTAPNG